jgi:hypothetical protein
MDDECITALRQALGIEDRPRFGCLAGLLFVAGIYCGVCAVLCIVLGGHWLAALGCALAFALSMVVSYWITKPTAAHRGKKG